MAAKKKAPLKKTQRKRQHKPGVLWRVVFGHDGPTRGALKKAWTQTLTKTFTIHQRDPLTGKVRKRVVRVEADGRIVEAKAKPKKKSAAKKTAAKRTASQPSKPSRASPAGSTQRRATTAAGPTPRRSRAAPMSERVLRNPDGTFDGSKSADPEQRLRRAEAEYRKAMKNAGAAGRHAEDLLGWRTPRP